MAVKKTSKSATRTSAKTRPGAAKKSDGAAVQASARAAGKGNGRTADKTKAQVEHAVTLAKANVDRASAAAFKGYDELAVLGQGNFEALVQSNSVVAKGIEAIGKEVMAFAQRSMEVNMAQARALIGARDLQEFVDLQNDFATQRLEATLAETAKLTELSTQVANEAIEPLQKRVDATVQRVLKAQAA